MNLVHQIDRVPGRTNGLDTLRAGAIALVFTYHYTVFVSHAPTFGPASIVGWVGVDLFFVLSGYLIANQILSGVASGETLSLKYGLFHPHPLLDALALR